MVVTVISVRVMQVIADKIVHVVAVRYLLMAAAGAVLMLRSMTLTGMFRGAAIGIAAIYFHRRLVDVIAVLHVHVSLVQVPGLSAASQSRVPAVSAVSVLMSLVTFAFHGFLLFAIQMSKTGKLLSANLIFVEGMRRSAKN